MIKLSKSNLVSRLARCALSTSFAAGLGLSSAFLISYQALPAYAEEELDDQAQSGTDENQPTDDNQSMNEAILSKSLSVRIEQPGNLYDENIQSEKTKAADDSFVQCDVGDVATIQDGNVVISAEALKPYLPNHLSLFPYIEMDVQYESDGIGFNRSTLSTDNVANSGITIPATKDGSPLYSVFLFFVMSDPAETALFDQVAVINEYEGGSRDYSFIYVPLNTDDYDHARSLYGSPTDSVYSEWHADIQPLIVSNGDLTLKSLEIYSIKAFIFSDGPAPVGTGRAEINLEQFLQKNPAGSWDEVKQLSDGKYCIYSSMYSEQNNASSRADRPKGTPVIKATWSSKEATPDYGQIFISKYGEGSVVADPIDEQGFVMVHVTPAPGYELASFAVYDGNHNDIPVAPDPMGARGFYMPEDDVTIEVIFTKIKVDPEPTPTPTPTPDPVEDVTIPETDGGAVEVKPVEAGETAQVVTEPEAGQEVRDVIVTDAEGNEVETKIDDEGTITFVMPEGGVTVEVVFGCDGGDLCGTHGFSDINHDNWYHDSIDWAVEEGIFHGYDNGTFGPDDTLTREMAATVLYNYFGGESGTDSSGLTDVTGDWWYTDAVNWAVANGVMTGYEGTGTFGVGDGLTREQFCSVVAKAMKVDLSDVDTTVLDEFIDVDSVSEWARPAVAWAVQQGILNGVEMDDGTRALSGIRDITRAEMAAMMKNAVDADVLVK